MDTYRVAVSDEFDAIRDPYKSLLYFNFTDIESAIKFVKFCIAQGKYAYIFIVSEDEAQ